MTLSSLCALDRVVHALELGEHESDGRFVTFRSARDGGEIELCGWLFLPVELWPDDPVDEHDFDAIPARRRDEEELSPSGTAFSTMAAASGASRWRWIGA